MSDTFEIGLPEAARHFGVPIRVLRRAIRAGKIPAPPHLTATSSLSAEWLSSAKAAVKASPPNALSRSPRQKVAPFARYEGTSAWTKHRVRVRAYARFRAAAKQTEAATATQSG